MKKLEDILKYVFISGPQPVAPSNPFPGMLAWADGTNWNPGEGAGIYHRNSANGWSLEFVFPQDTSGDIVGTSTTLAAASGTYTAVTGLSVAIGIGIYHIWAEVRTSISPEATTVGNWVYTVARFFDVTAGAAIANTERMVALMYRTVANVNEYQDQTAPIMTRYTSTAARTVRVEVARFYAGTPAASSVVSDANGRSVMRAQRVTL